MYTTNPCQLLAKYAAFLAIGLLLAASSARADLFNLTSDHCTGGCGPQTSFGTVTLTDNGNGGVDVVVSLLNGNQFIRTGSGAFMNFLFDDAAISLNDIVNITGTDTMLAAAGPLHADGTGSWDWGIYCSTCGTGGNATDAFPDDITFTVNNTTIADLTVGHAVNGFGTELFVADILSGTTNNTGPVDVNTPPVSTPDSGSTALFLGLGLFGLGFVRMPLRKKA